MWRYHNEISDETLRAVLGPIDNELDLGLGLSDVIDVIQTTDPTTAQEMFAQSNDLNRITDNQMNQHNTHNYNNSNMTNQKTSRPSGNDGNPTNRPSVTNSHSVRRRNYVQIIEQPAPKALRFRYECEGRSAGSIPGVNSTAENKTYPTIQICGEYRGRAVVVVSCVTKDEPYKPHPHNLVGREGCKKGVCTVEVNTDTMSVTFSNLGIQCVKKKDIEEALRVREEIRVDPFRTGFAHKTGTSIDLNTVRLCFQVFLESSEHKGKFTVPLDPVVSDPIFDKKGIQDLAISDISHTSCPVSGGTKIMLFCEKVAKDDVQVRFFEVDMQGKLLWEANGEFQPCNVHKQVAISFRAPPYRRLPITEPVKVLIQLERPSDGATGDPVEIDYIPSETGMRSFESLREKFQGVPDQTDIFQRIFMDKRYEKYLSNDKENEEPVEVVVLDSPVESKNIASTSQLPVNDASIEAQSLEKTIEWLEKAEFNGLMNADMTRNFGLNKDNSLNELLEQVAELDEIYSDHRLKRDTANVEKELNGYEYALPADPLDQMQADENFDDTATYSSLQIAFKNPIPMIDFVPPSPPVHKLPNGFPDDLDDMIVNPMAPIIGVGGVKRDNPEINSIHDRIRKKPKLSNHIPLVEQNHSNIRGPQNYLNLPNPNIKTEPVDPIRSPFNQFGDHVQPQRGPPPRPVYMTYKQQSPMMMSQQPAHVMGYTGHAQFNQGMPHYQQNQYAVDSARPPPDHSLNMNYGTIPNQTVQQQQQQQHQQQQQQQSMQPHMGYHDMPINQLSMAQDYDRDNQILTNREPMDAQNQLISTLISNIQHIQFNPINTSGDTSNQMNFSLTDLDNQMLPDINSSDLSGISLTQLTEAAQAISAVDQSHQHQQQINNYDDKMTNSLTPTNENLNYLDNDLRQYRK